MAAGEYIFRKGEAAKVMYLILEGEVDLMLGHTVIETAKEGTFTGERAMNRPNPWALTRLRGGSKLAVHGQTLRQDPARCKLVQSDTLGGFR